MPADRLIPLLLTLAWLAPLAGAVAAWAAGRMQVDRRGSLPAWVAVGGSVLSLNLALWAGLVAWRTGPMFGRFSGEYYTLAQFGRLRLALDYYVDGLTLLMFGVVTLIAACVHVYAVAYLRGGYSDDEVPGGLVTPHHDAHPVAAHTPLPRHDARFFAFLQLFCFSMLGLALAGNLLQVFAFWELVGACSYLLIGFYFERPAAAAGATKAFVMNRVGDAGFLVGIAILWTGFGSVGLGTDFYERAEHENGDLAFMFQGVGPLGFVQPPRESAVAKPAEGSEKRLVSGTLALRRSSLADPSHRGGWNIVPRWWLVVAGLGLFAGCVGKSAQLPLSTWLPDAMAGPTPVSALVHSATMVAAGVYLAARVSPLFLPEVLLVVAYVGAATLVYGATCAVVQTDLKRILAYSTVSQLGYMMLAIGVGGREAGLFHLVTHAFFKSLLFLAAGSVIVACHHVQDVTRLGGLRQRMPVTAYTSLVGVIAIGGLAIPMVEPLGHALAFSGYHSKDSILAAALTFVRSRPEHALLFLLPLLTAGLTAYYMFRFWLLAFAGTPRDEELHRGVRESPWLMTGPLALLAGFAAFVGVGGEAGALFGILEGSGATAVTRLHAGIDDAHRYASLWGLGLAIVGTLAAFAMYGVRRPDADRLTRPAGPVRRTLLNGWGLDGLYRAAFVEPARFLGTAADLFDRYAIDAALHGLTKLTVAVAKFDRAFDETVIDGFVNRLAASTYALGGGLRQVQTGRLRQSVMALAAAAVVLFMLAVVLMPK